MKFLNSATVTNPGTMTATSVIATSSFVLSGTNSYTINWSNPAAARTINVVDPTATSQLMLGVISSPASGHVLQYDGTKWVNAPGAQGPQGYQGFQGNVGTQGVAGSSGTQGNQGFQGRQGFQGVAGANGNQGNQGYQGFQGLTGNGTQGPQGSTAANAVYSTTFTSASLSAGLLTVTHNLNSTPVTVSVYNNSNQLIIPNQITLTSSNVATIDLNGYTITGTWSVVVLSAGSGGSVGSPLGGGTPNEVLFVDSGGLVAQSPALYFNSTLNQLGVGDSTLYGAMTMTGNAPSGDASAMALYNKGGGAGASVSADFYTTSANGGIPQTKVRVLDDGNYSTHVEYWTKNPGASTNSLVCRGKLSSLGSWVLNDGTLALSATDGFTYLPGCQGTPNGTPTAWAGVPVVYDTSGSQLWAYNAGWKTLGQQGPQGATGPQGTQGVGGGSGTQGTQGFQGRQGFQGVAGSNGTQGFQGVAGANGTQGNQGVQGFNGSLGTQGYQGVAGANGTQGNQGVQGFNGSLGTQGYQGNMGYQGMAQDVLVFVLGSGTPVTTGTDKTNRIYAVSSGSISKAFINAKTGPTGAALIIDIKKNGTSIWATTPSNRLQIAAGSTTGTQMSFDTTDVTSGDIFTIDVVQVGSTIPGQDVTVQLLLSVASAPGTQGYQGVQGANGNLAIGSPVGSGTNKSLLFVDGSTNLAQDNTNLNYDSASQTLTAGKFVGSGFPRDFTFLLDVGGSVTVGTDKSPWVTVPRAATASKVFISAKTPPAGSGIIVDILYSTNGVSFTSLWATTPANRPLILAGTYMSQTSTFDTTSIPAGALLRIDVIQVGSTTPGAGVVVQLHTLMKNF